MPLPGRRLATLRVASIGGIIGALYSDRTRDAFLRVYRCVADAYDLLTTFALAAPLEEAPSEVRGRFAVEQVCTGIMLFRALALASEVLREDSLDDSGDQLRSVTRAAADRVAELYMGRCATTDKEYQRGAEVRAVRSSERS